MRSVGRKVKAGHRIQLPGEGRHSRAAGVVDRRTAAAAHQTAGTQQEEKPSEDDRTVAVAGRSGCSARRLGRGRGTCPSQP